MGECNGKLDATTIIYNDDIRAKGGGNAILKSYKVRIRKCIWVDITGSNHDDNESIRLTMKHHE